MSMNATVQVRMDAELKTQVEALYRDLGTTFSEAVRIFAQQSLREGGMPFLPAKKTWEELTKEEIAARLSVAEGDIAQGRLLSQEELDSRITERLRHG